MQRMSAPSKFLFEDDFAAGHAERRRKPTISVAAHEAALAQPRRTPTAMAWRPPKPRSRAGPRCACDRIAQGITALTQGLSAIEARLEAESVEVAVAVARKLAPELIAAEPISEIAALAASCFRQLIAAPHVVVRIAEAVYEPRIRGSRRSRGCRDSRAASWSSPSRHGARGLPHRMGRRRPFARPRAPPRRRSRSRRPLRRGRRGASGQ